MRIIHLVGVLAALIMSSASANWAAVPPQFNVQGRLTDAGGVPLPEGNVTLTFRIYDAQMAGTLVWPGVDGETQTVKIDATGGWSADLGAVIPLTDQVFSGSGRWLEITVDDGAGTETLPRIQILAVPYAFRVATVDGAQGGHLNSALQAPELDIGDSSQSGRAQLFHSGSATPTIVLDGGESDGGSIRVRDESGNGFLRIEPDSNGTGGYFAVNRSTSSEGFFIDGNLDGTNEPYVGIIGSTRSATFDLGQAGDNSVILPPDAISSAEILDEPGVASNDRHAEFILTGGIDGLTSRTLTAPSAGYILAIATGEVILVHVTGTNSSGIFGLSDSASAFMAIQNITQIPSSAPTGTYKVALAAQTIIPVSAGLNRFYLLGQEVGGNLRASDLELSLLFVPTAYGTVDPPLSTRGVPQQTVADFDPATEPVQVEVRDSERIEREMAAMRAEFEELKAQMAAQRELNQPSVIRRR